jgi:hypothetical protein
MTRPVGCGAQSGAETPLLGAAKSDRFTMTGSGQTNTHRETLNQKRCLFCRAFELINNVTAPPRLHACAHTEPYWLNTCEPGTMAEATQWLNEQTENWRRRR